MVYTSDFLFTPAKEVQNTFQAPSHVAGDKPRATNLLPYKPQCHYLKRSLGRMSWTHDHFQPYQFSAPRRHFEPLLPMFVFAANQYDYKNNIFWFNTGFLRWSIPGIALGILHWYVRMSRNGWQGQNMQVTQNLTFDDE